MDLSRPFLVVLLLSLSIQFFAQNFQPPFSKAESRLEAFEIREKMKMESPLSNIPIANVGPTVFSGRVVDVEVNPEDPTLFYVAYASGGLWKTINNGTTFTPIFDQEAVMTIGDFDVHWDTGRIVVGTGEVNSSRSSYAGVGIYLSDDDGKSWSNIGLHDSHHIGKVLISENNPDEILVAALGHLYSENAERGVFKTTDAGNSWTKTLFINNQTGVVDLLRDPSNTNTLYAAAWQRDRKAWNFIESGEHSGIYKSTDNGVNWMKMTTANSGFPEGEGVGRIGLAIYNKNGTEKIYALLDNYNRRPTEVSDQDLLTNNQLKNLSKEEFIAIDDKKLTEYLTQNRFERKYSAKAVKEMVKADKILPAALAEYTEDANALLFDSQVIGAEVYVSNDGGKTWSKTHEGYIESLYNSYGYYFGVIEVSPQNPEKIYIAGVPILKSEDGGITWSNINKENVHVDHHDIWINPRKDGHLILGNDGGINISYDDGENWIKCNSPALGQFYYINVDNETPYNIYGGTQDNGVWYGPSNYEASFRWHSTGDYPYKGIVGGDGMQVQIDNRDNITVYAGSQFGSYSRINRVTGERSSITPRHELGERPYRWNWQTPILLSHHNQDVLYMGSNFLHRSMDKANNFVKISDDLTNGGRLGDVAYGTLTTIDESVFKFGLLYTGSDDGLIHVSKDGGYTWKEISKSLPQDMWVSRIIASQHAESRVYAALNGYRWDDFTPYLYFSEDYGNTWKRLGNDLPHEAINVVKEDPKDPEILYVGTDHGLYISFDKGETFTTYSAELPAVAVHDVVIHPRDSDIIIGTHGRSIYKGSGKELQQYNKIKNKDFHLFALESVRKSPRWGRSPSIFNPNPGPFYSFAVYALSAKNIEIMVKSEEDVILNNISVSVPKGISFQNYDFTIDPKIAEEYIKEYKLTAAEDGKIYLEKGKYNFVVGSEKQTLEIK